MLEPPRLPGKCCTGEPWNPLGPQTVARVQAGADWILEHVGLEVREHPETLERFDAAGARVVDRRVTFEPGQARELVRATVPARFVQRARNPEKDVVFGGAGTATAPLAGAPMVRGREGRRRYATKADHDEFARLTQQLDAIDHAGGDYCELTDRDTAVRHLHALDGVLRLTDKPVMGAAREPAHVADSLEMARIVFGRDRVDDECCLLNLFNLESPLVLTGTTAEGIRLTAEAGQGAIVTSYAILGMNAPVTLTGALPLMLAQVEAGLALTQLFAPGVPAIAGWYAAPFSMSAMRPAFGAVESMMAMAAGAQLMRALGCPVRADGAVTAAKTADQQAASDAVWGFEVARMAGVDFGLHSAGWLESGLCASRDKFMLDAAVMDTMKGRNRNRVQDGSIHWPDDWRAVLAQHEPPAMDEGVSDDLDRFIAERMDAYRANENGA